MSGVVTYLVKPVEMQVSSFNVEEEGDVILSTDADLDYTLTLTREGASLNQALTNLLLDLQKGPVGGDLSVRVRPPEGGVMPRSFSTPMNFVYSNDPSDGPHKYIGQDEMFVREFVEFDIDSNIGTRPFREGRNSRLFSYDSEMYFLTEFYTWHLGIRTNIVSLYKWDGSKFGLWHRFDKQFVDLTLIGSETQFGSPDVTIRNGIVYIAYRFIDRLKETNNFIVYSSSGDLTQWDELSSTVIKDTFAVEFDNFRLRIACDIDSIMVVTYGVKGFTRAAVSRDVESQDMRSYLSFDSGASFRSRSNSFSGVSFREDEGASRNQDFQNLSDFFIVNTEGPATEDSFVNFNVNFDLYYDRDMAAYVIMKGGDPILWDNRTHLVAIKTTSSSYFSWEPCLRYKMDVFANADVDLNGTEFEPYNTYLPPGTQNPYLVNDVEIIEGETYSHIMMSVQSVSGENVHSPINSENTVVGEFRFVPDPILTPGSYDRVFAYGGKFHPYFSFTCTPFHKDSQGLLAPGIFTDTGDIGKDVTEPIGCVWRNQLVMSEKRRINSYRGYAYLCKMKSWSNMGQRYGYEYAWSGLYPDFQEFHLQKVESFGGTIDYSEPRRSLRSDCGAGAPPENAYAAIVKDIAVGSLPGILERAGSGDGLWKTRFKVSVDSVSAEFKFFEGICLDANLDGYGLSLSFDTSNNILLKDTAGVTRITFNGFTTGTVYEIDAGVCRSLTGSVVYFFNIRAAGVDEWTHVGTFAAVKTSDVVSKAWYGMIACASGGTLVDIYEIQFSAYGKQMHSPVGTSKRYQFNGVEASAFYLETFTRTDPYFSKSAEVFQTDVALRDGEIIDFDGGFERGRNAWTVSDISSVNRASNVLNGTAFFNYDFTNRIQPPDYSHEIFFDKASLEDWDTLTLVGVFGCYAFNVTSGTYDSVGGVWSASTSLNFTIPYKTLTVGSSAGRIMIVNEEFEKSELKDYNILLYNTVTATYVDQLFIVENFGSVLNFDRAIPSLTDIEVRLFDHACSFSVTSLIGSGTVDHVSIEFLCSELLTNSSIGEVHFGRRMDLTDHITEMPVEIVTSESVDETDSGFLFSTDQNLGDHTRVAEVYSYSMSVMSNGLDSATFYRNHLLNLARNEQPVVIVRSLSSVSQQVDFGYLQGDVSESREGFVSRIDFGHARHFYAPFKRASVLNRAPALSIQSSSLRAYPLEVLTFTATSRDQEGDAVTYAWEFGDTNSDTGPSVTHNYTSEGSYTVTCTATDAAGNQAVKTLNMYVVKKETVSYEAVYNAAISINTLETITITAKDENNVTLTDNSFDNILFNANSDLVIFDSDDDGTVDQNNFIIRKLDSGIVTVDYEIALAGSYNILVTDFQGTFVIVSVIAS